MVVRKVCFPRSFVIDSANAKFDVELIRLLQVRVFVTSLVVHLQSCMSASLKSVEHTILCVVRTQDLLIILYN